MTKNDKELIERAEKLDYTDWAFIYAYAKAADTQEAKRDLIKIGSTLYREEEYSIRLL